MTYDVYCHKSRSGIPSVVEARAMLEQEVDLYNREPQDQNEEVGEKIVNALLECNPRLEVYKPNSKKVGLRKMAEAGNISEDAIRARWSRFEVNSPEGEPAIQLLILKNSVAINIPYWNEGQEADRLLSQLSKYLSAIRRVAGYFVYDSQREYAFDPAKSDNGSPFIHEYMGQRTPEVDKREGKTS